MLQLSMESRDGQQRVGNRQNASQAPCARLPHHAPVHALLAAWQLALHAREGTRRASRIAFREDGRARLWCSQGLFCQERLSCCRNCGCCARNDITRLPRPDRKRATSRKLWRTTARTTSSQLPTTQRSRNRPSGATTSAWSHATHANVHDQTRRTVANIMSEQLYTLLSLFAELALSRGVSGVSREKAQMPVRCGSFIRSRSEYLVDEISDAL